MKVNLLQLLACLQVLNFSQSKIFIIPLSNCYIFNEIKIFSNKNIKVYPVKSLLVHKILFFRL